MWPNVIVVNLIARNDRCVGFLESTHDFLSVADFPVESFHFVVVMFALNPDAVNMLGSGFKLMGVELFQVRFTVGW